jgi:N-acyl-D-amino-acid deacylase
MVLKTRREFLKTAAVAGGGLALSPVLSFNCSPSRELDIIISGGKVVNGLGSPAEMVDIGITGDKITAIGNLSGSTAGRTIQANGLTVAPGFIDIHAHTNLLNNPRAESKIWQGVTTDIAGPDGGSNFPRRIGANRERNEERELVNDINQCTNYKEWAETQSGSPAAMNVGSCIGHGTVRGLVLGTTLREPNDFELQLMQDLVAQALDQGALGLSSGLEYAGGMAKPAELTELCNVVAERGKYYGTHQRSEDQFVEEAVQESIQTARDSGVSLLLTHLKAVGEPNWHKVDKFIEMINRARDEGVNVHADRYPYLAWASNMSLFYPQWAKDGGNSAFQTRLKDRAERARMKEETLVKLFHNGGWESIMMRGGSDDIIGRRVDEIARIRNEDPYEMVCDMLSESGGIGIIGFGMSEENTEKIISLPYCMVASDGGAASPRPGPGGHPRSFGTFAVAFRKYVRERKVVSLEEMVRKCTSLPAEVIGITDRGRLQENTFADITIFDPETFTDHATYIESRVLATGVSYVLVNGQLVIDNKIQTDAMPGVVVSR